MSATIFDSHGEVSSTHVRNCFCLNKYVVVDNQEQNVQPMVRVTNIHIAVPEGGQEGMALFVGGIIHFLFFF